MMTASQRIRSQMMANGILNLYTTKAHVFQINTDTKNSWLTKSDSAIPISFVTNMESKQWSPTDQTAKKQRELKIIATDDNDETVLDSCITPETNFNKRSSKFGQWTDSTGMIYGLGFGSETELNEFIDMFLQLQSEILQPANDVTSSGDSISSKLQYENERLKHALEESSKNAGAWQSELLNLRTNNAKLTQALQESKAHVEEWERELLGLRDENKELKLQAMAQKQRLNLINAKLDTKITELVNIQKEFTQFADDLHR